MGVANSKRIYGPEEGDENVPPGGPTQQGAPAAPGDQGPQDKSEADKWKPFLKDILNMPETIEKVKRIIQTGKADKKNDMYGKKGIILDMDEVKNFVSGRPEYISELILFLKEGLAQKSGETIKFDQAKADAVSVETPNVNGVPVKNLKPGTTFAAVEKVIVEPMVQAAKLALKHRFFLRVLKEYITDTDTFKEAHKKENIDDKVDAIKSGETSVASAVEANKNKNAVNGPGAKDNNTSIVGGNDNNSLYSGGDSDSNIYSSGGSSEFDNDSIQGGDDILAEGGNVVNPAEGGNVVNPAEGGDNMDGGVHWSSFVPNKLMTDNQVLKNQGNKDAKRFKKETRADFDKKTEAFFKDTKAVDAFMEAHEDDILALMYYQKGVPLKWIDKSMKSQKKSVAEALVKAIIEYKPAAEPGAEGAEGEAPPGEGEAPPGEGEAPPGEDGAPPGEAPPEGEGAPGDAKPPEGAPGDKPNVAENVAKAVGEGVPKIGGQAGGGGKSKLERKKNFTRKKPQKINISINVGNDNNISDCSDSSSSSSSSSDSDSDSDSDSESESDSSSDSESSSDNKKRIKIIRKKKHTTRRKHESHA